MVFKRNRDLVAREVCCGGLGYVVEEGLGAGRGMGIGEGVRG